MRDSKREAWFTGVIGLNEGEHWEYVESVLLSEFDSELSLKNQARLHEPLDKETVDRYAICMLDGAQFPAIVAYRHSNGRLVRIGGNHRFAATEECGKESIDCYIIKISDPITLQLLTARDNTIEGKPQSTEENIEHAKQLVLTGAYDTKDAANMFGISYATLARNLRISKIDASLLTRGIEIQSNDVKDKLNKLADDEDIMISTARLIRTSKMEVSKAKELIDKLHEVKSHNGKERVLEEWSSRPAIQAQSVRPGRPRKTPKTYGDKAVESIESVSRIFASVDVSMLSKQIIDPQKVVADLQSCLKVAKAVAALREKEAA